MIRYLLARGDRAGSATIIEGLSNVTCSNPPPSVQIATLYMKTYCTACKREGFIAPKGPRHNGSGPNGKPWALSGDVNICGCNPPPVFYAVRAMKMTFTNEELARMNAPVAPAYVPQRADTQEYAHEKHALADEPAGLADDPELICPNMTNAQFGQHMMGLRDEALTQVDDRLRQLMRWSQADQAWFLLWFGTTDEAARSAIASGLTRMRRVLGLLTPSNFVRYTDEMTTNPGPGGCISRNSPGAVAEVCAPDTATHTIVIKLAFCVLRERHAKLDSQLLTLVHEVSHFDDVFSSRDLKYSTYSAKIMAKSKDERTVINADNIAGYVICSE